MSKFSEIIQDVLMSLALIIMGAGFMILGGVEDLIHGTSGMNPVRPIPAELAIYAPCEEEDGTGVDQVYPCVWDGARDGNGNYVGERWLIFGDPVTECPVPLPAGVRCEAAGS